jgi:purine-binding chemotaxis protein CheW
MEQVLLFHLGVEPCALDVAHIQEIVESPPFFFIPLAPTVFSGAINFHGTIVPVLDLGACLGFAGGQRDGRIIVLAVELCSLALAVSSIQRIILLDTDELSPTCSEGPLSGLSRATFSLAGETVNLLDLAHLLARLEMTEKRTGGNHGA